MEARAQCGPLPCCSPRTRPATPLAFTVGTAAPESARRGTESLAVGMVLLASKRDTGRPWPGPRGCGGCCICPECDPTGGARDAARRPYAGASFRAAGLSQRHQTVPVRRRPALVAGRRPGDRGRARGPKRARGAVRMPVLLRRGVRMRAGDALEKIARIRPELLAPFTRRLLGDVADVDQPSIQWHLAQILTEIELTPQQRQRAIAILKRNLERYEDWIVLNLTLHALAHFARDDPELTANWYRSCEATKPIPASRSQSARPSSSRSYSKRHSPEPNSLPTAQRARTSPSLENPADGKADPPGKILVLRPQELERERPVSALELPQPGPVPRRSLVSRDRNRAVRECRGSRRCR